MIEIKDKSGKVRFTTPINQGSKRRFQLMKEDYITLKFSVEKPVYFHLGDGIDNEIGIFELVDLYKPTYNAGTAGYDYELRLDAYYWKWKNKKFFYTPEDGGREASWNLTATLETHMKAFLKNLEKLGYKYRELPFGCVIDDTVDKSSKLVSYDNCNLIDALTQMAETWECEWWMEDHNIRFGRCEFSDPVDLEFGVNVNKMDRSDGQNKYASRIYAFGSTRNIPPTYRKKLVFDVKEVNGRDISDTARMLEGEYFPFTSRIISSFDVQYNEVDIVNAAFLPNVRHITYVPIHNLQLGTYNIIAKNIYTSASNISSHGRIIGGNATFGITYKVGGEVKEIVLQSKNASQFDDQYIQINTSFDNSSLTIDGDATECRLFIRWMVKDKIGTMDIAFHCIIAVAIQNKEESANTVITFLSGTNEDRIFDAIYNPDFLTGDDANVIRLPEGITASPGDMYTINNIIKGKVPDKYFSKDDNETTVNGVVQKRLMLPVEVPYVDADKDMTQEEAIEEIVVFEDVYAKYTGSTMKVPEPKWEDEKVGNELTGNKYPIYTFKDTGITNFNKKDFVIDELRLIFQTGNLSGLDFALDIKESDNTGTTFEIFRNEDYGRFLPDNVLFPQEKHMEDGKEVPADTYILYGFDTAFISEQMLPAAEKELLKKAQEYVEKSKIDPSTYNCELNSSWVYEDQARRTFTVGDKVNLINKAYFDNGRQSRIIGYEYNLDIPYDHPVYTVGETAAYSRLGAIENRLDSLIFKGQTYGGSVVGGGGASVYVIGINDKTLPSDRNVFSSKKSLYTFLNKTEDDIAVGHITFENGILVRKQEIVETATMSIMEEGDAIIEELTISQESVTTLGGMENVSEEADNISETNDLLVRPAGSSKWIVDTTLLSDVSQLMGKVFPFTFSLTGGGVYEKGSTQIINLSWSYDRDITSQSINGEAIAMDVHTKQFADVSIDTTYTLSAVCNGQIYTKSVSAGFRVKKYYGVSMHSSLTNEQVLALSSSWAGRAQSSTVFDCTGGKYPYYILPTSMVSGIQFWIGGLRNSDWAEEVREVTNAHGYTESYTIFRLNSIQTGVLNIEVK